MNHTLALACLMAVGLAACGGNEAASAPSVEGKWCSAQGNATFLKDGKVEMESDGEKATGTYTFDGKTVIAKRDDMDVTAVITLGEDDMLRTEDPSSLPMARCP